MNDQRLTKKRRVVKPQGYYRLLHYGLFIYSLGWVDQKSLHVMLGLSRYFWDTLGYIVLLNHSTSNTNGMQSFYSTSKKLLGQKYVSYGSRYNSITDSYGRSKYEDFDIYGEHLNSCFNECKLSDRICFKAENEEYCPNNNDRLLLLSDSQEFYQHLLISNSGKYFDQNDQYQTNKPAYDYATNLLFMCNTDSVTQNIYSVINNFSNLSEIIPLIPNESVIYKEWAVKPLIIPLWTIYVKYLATICQTFADVINYNSLKVQHFYYKGPSLSFNKVKTVARWDFLIYYRNIKLCIMCFQENIQQVSQNVI